jgi:hypothetical protein
VGTGTTIKRPFKGTMRILAATGTQLLASAIARAKEMGH